MSKTSFFRAAFLLVLFFISSSFNQPFNQNKNPAAWMRHTSYGVFVHYLEQLQNGQNPWRQGKRTDWDACVNDFNVNTFAQQVHDIGAGYVIFSVYQASKYLCIPNETYEQMTGYPRGKATSHRDLVADLYTALSKYNIRLMLYATGDGTYADSVSNKAFDNPMLLWKQHGNKFIATQKWVNNWSKVLREISTRYGSKISGWWIDGAFSFHGYNDDYLKILRDALKAGNPNSIVAFNPAPREKVIVYSKWDDYTAGEMYKLKDLPPPDGLINGIQWHEATFLGSNWQQPGVKFNTDSLVRYINKVNARKGVISFDVCTLRDGSVDATQYNFMKQVSRRVRR